MECENGITFSLDNFFWEFIMKMFSILFNKITVEKDKKDLKGFPA
jgi:hypothetical protein